MCTLFSAFVRSHLVSPLPFCPNSARPCAGEFDDYVQCTECSRWFHFVCGMYPAPEQCPRQWRLEAQLFVCPHCVPSVVPPPSKALTGAAAKEFARRSKLLSLQTRRAADLPTCALSDAIEAHLASELKSKGVELPSPIVVRVVSRKRLIFPAVKEVKQRYGSAYAAEFPYLSQAILCFQSIGSPRRDVLLFAVYVQEYDAYCPPPNTNRTYISYVDSVPYLESSPPNARTPVYHAVLGGYLKHAAACGFEHCHLWVAPPEGQTEYVFHARPVDGRPPMSADVLRGWYERLLAKAQQTGSVTRVADLSQHVADLTSVRNFPLFDGDFFPDRMEKVMEKSKHPGGGDHAKSGGGNGNGKNAKGGGKVTMLARSETLEIADQMKREVSGSNYSFLVATLNSAKDTLQVGREKQITSHELIDDRERFLELCMHRHWQFDQLRRAQWSTMMLLALLGGSPDTE